MNEFTNDARVLRASKLGMEMGSDVYIFALHRTGLLERETCNNIAVRRFRLLTRPLSKAKPVQLIKYLEAIIRMVLAGIKLRPDLVHANDLSALPIGYLVAKFTGAKLLYDSHELWFGAQHRANFPRWMYNLGLAMERVLAKRADAVVTVSESIAEEMHRKMGIPKPQVIRNTPDWPKSTAVNSPGRLRVELGISHDIPILLYQGGIAKGRGLELLVQALTYLKNSDAVLVFLGNGPLVEVLKQTAKDAGIEQRVLFHPAVPPHDLPLYTVDATLGLSPIEGMCLNHRLCLPNKLFEYIQAGVPVVATDFPELRRTICSLGIGELFPDGSAVELARVIDGILADPVKLERYKRNAQQAAPQCSWEVEKKKLMEIYRILLGKRFSLD